MVNVWSKTIIGGARWKTLLFIIPYKIDYYFTAIYNTYDMSCLVCTYTSMTSCNAFIYLTAKIITNNYKDKQ